MLPFFKYFRCKKMQKMTLFKNCFWKHLFFSNTHNDNAYYINFDNSTAMHKDLKTLRPDGIRTRDLRKKIFYTGTATPPNYTPLFLVGKRGDKMFPPEYAIRYSGAIFWLRQKLARIRLLDKSRRFGTCAYVCMYTPNTQIGFSAI
jgi:hypothetical protein